MFKPLSEKLSRQFFYINIGIIVASFSIIYLFSVPLIEKNIFDIEQNSSRLVLNNVFEIASRMYSNVEDYESQALEAHQQQLKVAISLSASYISASFRDAEQAGVPIGEARQKVLSEMREFTYGNNDYIWIADHDGVLISHPDDRFHNKLAEPPLDENGQPIVETIVKRVLKEGDGFYEYKWHRLDGNEFLDKVSYVKNYPEWGFVIGTGVYLADLKKEVQHRKETALADLRLALSEIKVAKTGYLFIFDSNKKMLIHPNTNIDGIVFDTLINPLTKQSIADELMGVADTGKELIYQWDKPDDPDNYIYQKFSLVRYLPGFDWYICSSVYLDELLDSSETLTNRLITLATLTTIVAMIFSYFFVTRITRPLEKLANTALKVRQGDLSTKSGITGDDEVGVLAASFDGMVERLKSNIDSLDMEVKQRTDELVKVNAQAQHMRAVGQLAGGLAHDFNNLLSIILGNLLLVRDRYKSTKGLDSFLAPAIGASHRGANITHRLLAFSRRQPLQPIPQKLDTLLTETIKLLGDSMPANITLNYQPTDESVTVYVDPSHLESALVNLGFNACDAITEEGALSFTTSLVTFESDCLERYDELVPAGDYVEISVKDSGSGFSDEALEKAFEPFYTTKKGSDNSGLGLSMVYGFVKQSDGYISIQNSPGDGACINLLLPIWQGVEESKEQDDVDYSDSRLYSGKLFLLVEDNADVRKVVREQLIELGVKVIEASNASEAKELIATIDNLDGMVSDYMLNDHMDGQELAKILYKKDPKSIILLISGYSYDENESKKTGKYFPLLRKPFDQKALGHALWLAVKTSDKEHSNNDG